MKVWEFCRGPCELPSQQVLFEQRKRERHDPKLWICGIFAIDENSKDNFVVCPGNLKQPRNGVGRKGSAEATAEAMRKIGTTAENPLILLTGIQQNEVLDLMLGWTSSQVLLRVFVMNTFNNIAEYPVVVISML